MIIQIYQIDRTYVYFYDTSRLADYLVFNIYPHFNLLSVLGSRFGCWDVFYPTRLKFYIPRYFS